MSDLARTAAALSASGRNRERPEQRLCPMRGAAPFFRRALFRRTLKAGLIHGNAFARDFSRNRSSRAV